MSGARIELNDQSVISLSDLLVPQRLVKLQNDSKDPWFKYAAPEILGDSVLKQDTGSEIFGGLGLTSLAILGIEQEIWEIKKCMILT